MNLKTKLAGTSYDGREKWIGKCTRDTKLRLKREPDNPYDENAIKVEGLIGPHWRDLGYVPKKRNSSIAKFLDEDAHLEAVIQEVTQDHFVVAISDERKGTDSEPRPRRAGPERVLLNTPVLDQGLLPDLSDSTQVVLSSFAYFPRKLIRKADCEKLFHYRWKQRENGAKVIRELRAYQPYQTDHGLRIAVPRGDPHKLEKLFNGHNIIVDECTTPLGVDLTLNNSVVQHPRWGAQRHCIKEAVAARRGIVVAEPGFGKSVVGIGIIARLGLRTLILTTRRDGEAHWRKEIAKHTNLPKNLVGGIDDERPITIATVQSLCSSKGRRLLAGIHRTFGLVLVDEIHEFGTPRYAEVLATFSPFAFIGLTATPERTDNYHLYLYDLVGPIIATGSANPTTPAVTFVWTGVTIPGWLASGRYSDRYCWQQILRYLASHEARYEVILSYLRQDIEDGRSILVTSDRLEMSRRIYQTLQSEGISVGYVDGKTKKRERIYDDLREGRIQVLCAGRVTNAMVDLPIVDCLHVLTPVSAKAKVKQLWGRVRRNALGKRSPVIRDYVDKGGQLWGAYKSRRSICEAEGWPLVDVSGATPLSRRRITSRRENRKTNE